MNHPQRILTIEITTSDNPSLDFSQLPTLNFLQDGKNLRLNSDIEQIKSAIADAVIHLGSNYRHPLYFNVQVIPTESKSSNNNRRRRRRKTNKDN